MITLVLKNHGKQIIICLCTIKKGKLTSGMLQPHTKLFLVARRTHYMGLPKLVTKANDFLELDLHPKQIMLQQKIEESFMQRKKHFPVLSKCITYWSVKNLVICIIKTRSGSLKETKFFFGTISTSLSVQAKRIVQTTEYTWIRNVTALFISQYTKISEMKEKTVSLTSTNKALNYKSLDEILLNLVIHQWANFSESISFLFARKKLDKIRNTIEETIEVKVKNSTIK